MRQLKRKLQREYLDWKRNYSSMAAYAMEKDLSLKQATRIVEVGRKLYSKEFGGLII